MRFDLHVHTTLSSCSRLDIGDILANARARGLDGVCITDHDTMDVRHAVREGVQKDGLCLIVGMEYETPDGDFLLFGPFETLEPGLSAPRMLDIVRREGGAAIAAHPCRSFRATSEHIVRNGLCRIVEGINGRNSDAENLRADRWRQRYEVRTCGGSDAHALDELGRVWTRFSRPVRSRADLIAALNGGPFAPERNSPRQPSGIGKGLPAEAFSRFSP